MSILISGPSRRVVLVPIRFRLDSSNSFTSSASHGAGFGLFQSKNKEHVKPPRSTRTTVEDAPKASRSRPVKSPTGSRDPQRDRSEGWRSKEGAGSSQRSGVQPTRSEGRAAPTAPYPSSSRKPLYQPVPVPIPDLSSLPHLNRQVPKVSCPPALFRAVRFYNGFIPVLSL